MFKYGTSQRAGADRGWEGGEDRRAPAWGMDLVLGFKAKAAWVAGKEREIRGVLFFWYLGWGEEDVVGREGSLQRASLPPSRKICLHSGRVTPPESRLGEAPGRLGPREV